MTGQESTEKKKFVSAAVQSGKDGASSVGPEGSFNLLI